jgi:hypothetical protein
VGYGAVGEYAGEKQRQRDTHGREDPNGAAVGGLRYGSGLEERKFGQTSCLGKRRKRDWLTVTDILAVWCGCRGVVASFYIKGSLMHADGRGRSEAVDPHDVKLPTNRNTSAIIATRPITHHPRRLECCNRAAFAVIAITTNILRMCPLCARHRIRWTST